MNDTGFLFVLKTAWRALRLFTAIAVFSVGAYYIGMNWMSLVKYCFKPFPARLEGVNFWTPEKFSIANKASDGSYLSIKSLNVTNIAVPIEAYKLLSKNGENTLVAQSDGTIHYFTKTEGQTFVATERHQGEVERRYPGEMVETETAHLLSDSTLSVRAVKDTSQASGAFFFGTLLCVVAVLVLKWFVWKIAPRDPFQRSGWIPRTANA